MEALNEIVAYLEANPVIAGALTTLLGSLGVAISKAGGERFKLLKRLYRLLTK